MCSLNDGTDSVINIFSFKLGDLKMTDGYLNQTNRRTIALFFFLTGCMTYSALVECNNTYGIYAVAVKPWDFIWNRIFTLMAGAFNV